MDRAIQEQFDRLYSEDRQVQYQSHMNILETAKQPVDWAYDIWDLLKEDLTAPDAHQRSRAAQYLSYLAISDPENRILTDFPLIWARTYDEKFVVTRHALQAVWRIGLAGDPQLRLVIDHQIDRFRNCGDEKHAVLIRSDIQRNLRHLYDATGDDSIKQHGLVLAAEVKDKKYQKRYKDIWK
ncbi:hypothetical protein [Planococcus lenghuensis]|uniref:HEAT repeat domain-containing protein n=1 Tax=Planococcus lenghuensis TaxID=2213202 RepID=A0A1Q2KW80_9BACL|nr:hypothetical protein [Planococcus lenghuensis]AQQ52374.1 hypothetical protein B0X71_04095 [Planococcus lenghuensis]